MQPVTQKTVFFTRRELGRQIHKHGLPVTITAAGSGVTAVIKKTTEIAKAGRKILSCAAACESGFIIE